MSSNYPIQCTESVMSEKAHGTCERPVMDNLRQLAFQIVSIVIFVRWNCDFKTADRICCYNRHYAEHSGYWEHTTFLQEESGSEEITFYDSVSGKPLFIAPKGRSFADFVKESKAHGWPSFRDQEVGLCVGRCNKIFSAYLLNIIQKQHRHIINLYYYAGVYICVYVCIVWQVVWDNMRCLPNGEAVSVDGTHLGHNLPDRHGNRYCINLVSVAGRAE